MAMTTKTAAPLINTQLGAKMKKSKKKKSGKYPQRTRPVRGPQRSR